MKSSSLLSWASCRGASPGQQVTSARPLHVGSEPCQRMSNFLLPMWAVMAGHSSSFWMTLPQVSAAGAKVRKDDRSDNCHRTTPDRPLGSSRDRCAEGCISPARIHRGVNRAEHTVPCACHPIADGGW